MGQTAVSKSSSNALALQRTSIHATGGFKQASISTLSLVHASGQSSAIQKRSGESVTLLQGFVQPLHYWALQQGYEITLYPNPSQGVVHCTVSELDLNLQLKVFTLQGRLVHTSKVSFQKQKLDLSELPKGVYTIAIERLGEQLETQKLVLI